MNPFLQLYKPRIEKALQDNQVVFGDKLPLQGACLYALNNGGKRFRPALVMMIAEALKERNFGIENDVSPSAIAVEYFHTASLIADDLPCMDDDHERRGKPAVHVVYGEGVAILASFTLISEGYAAIGKNTQILLDRGEKDAGKIGAIALGIATSNAGVLGATGGQYLDLFPPKVTQEVYLETARRKTVSLFEISMVLGWLFGGGSLDQIPLIKKAAFDVGLAFQIGDDFGDAVEDAHGRREMNLVTLIGKEKATDVFCRHVEGYLGALKELKIDSSPLRALADLLYEMIKPQPALL